MRSVVLSSHNTPSNISAKSLVFYFVLANSLQYCYVVLFKTYIPSKLSHIVDPSKSILMAYKSLAIHLALCSAPGRLKAVNVALVSASPR